MPRPKRFDYYMDEVDWSYGHGYRIRIPYVDATGAKRIYHQTFSTRKLGLDMVAAKHLAKAQSADTSSGRRAPRQAQEGQPRKPCVASIIIGSLVSRISLCVVPRMA